jgi:hypothetical protein
VIEKFQNKHGVEKNLPANTLTLKSIPSDTRPDDWSLEQIDTILKDYVQSALDGDFTKLTTSTRIVSRPLAAPKTKNSFTVQTLLNAYARALYKNEQPGEKVPGTSKIFQTKGYSKSDVIDKFHEKHGIEKATPVDMLILSSIPTDTALEEWSLEQVETILNDYIQTALGGDVTKLTTSASITRRSLAAPGSKSSFTVKTLVRAYARALYIQEHSGEKAPSTAKIFQIEGYSPGDVIGKFRNKHGIEKNLPTNALTLKSFIPATPTPATSEGTEK